MLEGARETLLWKKAAQHRHGLGMGDGLDMTVITKHYNWYMKNCKMLQAGAIMAIYTGAMWPGDRLDPGDDRYRCPRCQHPGYDEAPHGGQNTRFGGDGQKGQSQSTMLLFEGIAAKG
eukprot:10635596-Karenia_brevis.AAC.1